MGVETTLLAMAVVGGVVGTAASVYGSYKEGQDAAEASRYNASIARESAGMTEQAGALDAQRQRKQVSRVISAQKAQAGASGIELTGSPLDVMIESATEGELDAQIIEYNTKVRARGFMSQASYDDQLATTQERAGLFKAGTTLLTSATQIGSQYYGAGYKRPTKSGYQGTFGSLKLTGSQAGNYGGY